MRRMNSIILIVGLAIVFVASASAQQRQKGQRGNKGGGGPGGFGGVGMLLANEGVQKELKLDTDQVAKAKDAVGKVREKHKDDFAKLSNLSREEQREKGQELSRVISEETKTALADILKPDQLKRLNQIELQQGGLRAFSRPEVQKALNLTSEQKEKLKTISDDLAKDMRELFAGGNRQGGREKMTALNKEAMEKIQAVLTDDQKKAWKDLTGDPFEIPRGQGQGRGRRPNTN